jgi:hypothetical protein
MKTFKEQQPTSFKDWENRFNTSKPEWIKDIINLKHKDCWGKTIAHTQVLYGWITEDYGLLALTSKHGEPVAHYQVKEGWTTEHVQVLKLNDAQTNTVAHLQAEQGWITNDPNILRLTNNKNKTVLDYIAEYKFDNRKLNLLDIEEIASVKEKLIYTLPKLKNKSLEEIHNYFQSLPNKPTFEQLPPTDVNDWENRFDSKNPEIIDKLNDLNIHKLDKVGIARSQIFLGWKTEDKDTLKLTNEYKESIAHLQAEQGWITNDPKLLDLTNENEESVAYYIIKYKIQNKPHVLTSIEIENHRGTITMFYGNTEDKTTKEIIKHFKKLAI